MEFLLLRNGRPSVEEISSKVILVKAISASLVRVV
jgi:hypothetical protein